MVLSSFLLSSLVVASASRSLAAPSFPPTTSFSIDLKRRAANHPGHRTTAWAAKQGASLRKKYPGKKHGAHAKAHARATGSNGLTNLNEDSTYFGSIAVGTPATPFDVILDTGSSDLWLASRSCLTCRGGSTYDPTASSSSRNQSAPFSITYGSGDAAGDLFSDNVQFAGFEVSDQVFAAVDQVSDGILEGTISGLLGLAWAGIATSGATPLVQALAEQQPAALDSPLFSFFLTRYADSLTAEDDAAQFGGQFTLGTTNSTFFQGPIDFVNIPPGKNTFWTLPLVDITVQGTSVPITAGEQFAAIDTGTTLIGGPADMIAAVFAQIPGSAPGTGDLDGYFTYPCATSVAVSLSFGSQTWSIPAADFELMEVSNGQCVGALFTIDIGGSGPSWIVGDTFLKNVYSVFRFAPPAVGFAPLSEAAHALSRPGEALPTPTVVADPVVASASTQGAMERVQNRPQQPAAAVGAAVRTATARAALAGTLLAALCALVL